MEGRVVCVQHQRWCALPQCWYNRGLFGLPVHHIVRSDSVWNSLVSAVVVVAVVVVVVVVVVAVIVVVEVVVAVVVPAI